MCGRYGVTSDFKTWGIQAHLPGFKNGNFNATPQSFLPILRKEQNTLVPELMRWGLVPHWSQGSQTKFSTFNAKSETITISPAFRDSFYKRRCLVPTLGFYEWKHNGDGSKTPYFIRLKSRPNFAMAGIWDSWKDAEGKELRTFSILTTTPNELVQPIHNRMPVIIPKEIEQAWLNPGTTIESLQTILQPYDASNMYAYRVGTMVNSTFNNDERLIEPVDASE